MALSDTSVRAAKQKPAQYKLYDERGLVLLVRPSGGKLWRLKYRVNGKEKQLALGRYPDVSLKMARERRDLARKLLTAGKDPGTEKKRIAVATAIGAASTFKAVTEELIAKMEREGRADATLDKTRWLLSLFEPSLGARPIAEIEAFELLAVLRQVEARGRYETAKRLRSFAGTVFRYAVVTSRARSNPAADLQGALTSPVVKHRAAIVDPKEVGALLRAIDGFEGQPSTKLALQLASHVFVRPGELRHAEWSEFDLAGAVWRIPATKTKMRREHTVPLSRQALTILNNAKELTGSGRYVFPSVRTLREPMSENTLNAALRRMGYGKDEMTAHGFRSTASTLLNESGKWSEDAIESALAHRDSDRIRAIYHRGTHWKERVAMAQWWSDYLDNLRPGTTITFLQVANQ